MHFQNYELKIFKIMNFKIMKIECIFKPTDEGSVPEMCIWSMLLIKLDLKMVYTS